MNHTSTIGRKALAAISQALATMSHSQRCTCIESCSGLTMSPSHVGRNQHAHHDDEVDA